MLTFITELFNKYIVDSTLLFHAVSSFLTSFFLCMYITSNFINLAKKINLFQFIRLFGPKTHFSKKNTPTMGGIAIILSIIISISIWSNLHNSYVKYTIFMLISYGIIGFIDDFNKIKNKSSSGLTFYWKYFLQSAVTLIFLIFIFFDKKVFPESFLFLHSINTMLYPKIIYLIFLYFFIICVSNSVNISDGLDGLISIPVIISSFALSIISWISSNRCISRYLHIPYIEFSNELIIFCLAISGSCLGFLWFNAYPAQIFMGDVGSLAIGGSMSVITIFLHKEILFFFIGNIFIIEVFSVLLQVFSFKILNKRIFLMSPIHHHFELQGYSENKIVIRFWIVSLIICIFSSLIALKI